MKSFHWVTGTLTMVLANRIERVKAIPKANRSMHSLRTIPKHTEPAFIEPMQCKSELPPGEKWTFEIKFDGYRCVAVKRGWEVTLFSRHMKVLNRRFPNVVEALASLDGDFVLDGELVALDSQEGHHSRCCRPVLRRFFTPSIYSNKMASSW